MGGSSTADQPGIYGTEGVPSAANVPGGRIWACSATDTSGNFWLFGGYGWGSGSQAGSLNDFWEYSNGKWTWMGGLNQAIGSGNPLLAGVYGTIGVPASGNQPGARDSATCWTDSRGNFWVYGGQGFDSTGAVGQLGDLWRYSNNEWTWVSGSNIAAQTGITGAWQGAAIYGTKGIAAASNTPGVRQWASGWTDPSGNLWLFGGLGVIANGTYGEIGTLDDLWRYSNGKWTWMAGSNQIDQYGVYGTLGTAAPGNTPGSRSGAAAWIDASGSFWLFGGLGVGTSGDNCGGSPVCVLNDLWEFSPSLNEWIWAGGPDLSNQPGAFGTQGVAVPENLPPPREEATTWIDSQGNFWLFGGDDGAYPYNDLWRYSQGEWTWESGSKQVCQAGIYGGVAMPSSVNIPGARIGAVGWTDKSGNLWLFGGGILDCPGYSSTTKLNDLWEYQP